MAETFVEVQKDGVHLIVHPSTVKSHQAAGWIVVREGASLPSKGKKDEPVETEPLKEPPAEGKK